MKMNSQTVEIRGQKLNLLPDCCVYWEAKGILLLSDVHLGKAEHFRRSGIPIPNAVSIHNIQVLRHLLEALNPSRIIILGDLFHANYNSEWNIFSDFRQQYHSKSFELVPGNHDILEKEIYEKASLQIHPSKLVIPPFVFSHELLPEVHSLYNISGHVHPAIKLIGKGGQSLRFPCFYFGKEKGLLPAFGAFTGMYTIKPCKEDSAFIIGDGRVIKL
jgi:DNA ligase-associated metallophosphoesterase